MPESSLHLFALGHFQLFSVSFYGCSQARLCLLQQGGRCNAERHLTTPLLERGTFSDYRKEQREGGDTITQLEARFFPSLCPTAEDEAQTAKKILPAPHLRVSFSKTPTERSCPDAKKQPPAPAFSTSLLSTTHPRAQTTPPALPKTGLPSSSAGETRLPGLGSRHLSLTVSLSVSTRTWNCWINHQGCAKLQCMSINSVPWFVIAHNVLLEGAATVALNTVKLLPPAGMMLQEQNHQEQSGHTSIFFFLLYIEVKPSWKWLYLNTSFTGHYSDIKSYLLLFAKPSNVLLASQLRRSHNKG